MNEVQQSYEHFSSMGPDPMETRPHGNALKPIETRKEKMRRRLEFILGCGVEVQVLTALVLGCFLQSILFFFNVTCSPWPMWLTFGGMLVLLVISSWKRALAFLAIVVVLFVLTAYTYSYTGTDAAAYHFPQQILLKNGWNPIYVSTIESFDKMVGDFQFWRTHALFLPNLNALCGALVGLSTGLMVADSFLNFVFILVVFRVAFRFAQSAWNCGIVPAVIFSLYISLQTKITSFLAGQVDYLTYATLASALFCSYLWYKERKLIDLFVLFLAMTVGMLVKTTGLICCGLTGIVLLIGAWKDRRIWIAGASIAVMVLIIGAHPLLTSLYHYKCPFYPTMSFCADIPVIDITDDFSGNADALSMGWMSRVAYAWFSPTFVTKLHSLFLQRDFCPEFTVCGGVAGYGAIFRLLLLASLIALLAAKKNLITLMVVFVFVLSNFAPTKYIGYRRYFPQIWLIPILAAYQLMYGEQLKTFLYRLMPCIRIVVCVCVVVWIAFVSIRTLAYQGRMLQFENLRQKKLCEFSSHEVGKLSDCGAHSFAMEYRARCAGAHIKCLGEGKNIGLPCTAYGDTHMLVVSKSPCESQIAELNAYYPIIDHLKQLKEFQWGSAFKMPDVVWNKGGYDE